MKFNFKLLAVAAALSVSGASSFAAIVTSGSTPDLIFVAYDNTGANVNSYVRDLGSISQLGTTGSGSLALNAPAGSIFATQFAGVAPANIAWNVYAISSTGNGTEWQTGSLADLQAYPSDVAGTISLVIAGGLANLQATANGYVKPNGEYTGTTNQSPSSDQSDSFQLNSTLQGGNESGLGVGSKLNLIKLVGDGAGGDTATQVFLNSAGVSAVPFNDGGNGNNAPAGYFTLADASGDLTWTDPSSTAAVPLPGAFLLFGPGLMGLFGAARRRFKA